MSKQTTHQSDNKAGDRPGPQTWQQRYGAMLLLAGFGVLIVVMVVLQKAGR